MYSVVFNPASEVSDIGTYSAGNGISIIANVIANTGVLSLVAGTNIGLSGGTGNVTVSVTGTVASATVATNLSGGLAGSVPYQTGANTSTFLGIGTAGQVLTVNAGATAPQWVNQSTLSAGTATVGTTSTITTTSTNATYYPTFVSADTGNIGLGANTNLTFNPSTGLLTATTLSGALTGATTGSTLLAGNGSGGLANVTVGSGLQLVGGTLSNTEAGGSVTTVSIVTSSGISGTVANASTTPAITLAVATQTATDNSANAATTAYVQAREGFNASTKTHALGSTGGGTYSTAGVGSGAIILYNASGGAITTVVSFPTAGSGYAVGDIVVATTGNDNAVFWVTSVSSGGITGVQILNGGTGYTGTGSTGLLREANASANINTFIITGTLTSNATWLMTPGTAYMNSKQWIVCNNTTGAYTLTFKLSGQSGGVSTNTAIGTGVVIPQGTNNSAATAIFTDGINDIWIASSALANAGTVSTLSIVSANGFAGTVANATTTPAITLTASITGLLKGNGTAISAATSGTDYSAGTSALATGILKSTTSSGALTIAVAADFPTLNQNTTGNAATVTTNANLTGVITSVGNATSIASQTGTGTTFVMSNSPTLSTPNLGTPSTIILTNATGFPTLNQSTTGNAATATSISGGVAGSMPYQSAGSTTGFTAAGNPGQQLTSSGTGAPVWSNAIPYIDAGGTSDVITATYSPAYTSLADGITIALGASAANTTTTPTLNVNGLGAKTIVKNNGQALVAGDIGGSSSQLLLQYNATTTQWELINPTIATTAVNMLGGTTGQMMYQSAANTTAFTSGITVATTGTAALTIGSSATMESILIPNGSELMNIISTAPASTTTVYANTGAIQTYTTAATANFIFNFVWSSSTTFNTATGVWTSNTFTIMVLQGATPYYCTSVQVDGTTSGVTTYWQGGTAPSAGNASGYDVYTFSILKTAASTYIVLASLTKF